MQAAMECAALCCFLVKASNLNSIPNIFTLITHLLYKTPLTANWNNGSFLYWIQGLLGVFYTYYVQYVQGELRSVTFNIIFRIESDLHSCEAT